MTHIKMEKGNIPPLHSSFQQLFPPTRLTFCEAALELIYAERQRDRKRNKRQRSAGGAERSTARKHVCLVDTKECRDACDKKKNSHNDVNGEARGTVSGFFMEHSMKSGKGWNTTANGTLLLF